MKNKSHSSFAQETQILDSSTGNISWGLVIYKQIEKKNCLRKNFTIV